MNLGKAAILIASAILYSGQVQAATVVVDANSSGFCRSDPFCNNTFQGGFQNNFAGILGPSVGGPEGGAEHRNFFSFNLPAGSVTSAVLSIFNDGRNFTQQPGTSYTVRGVSTNSFEGLGSGPTFGSISVAAADTGVSHYVEIVLNSAAIAQLNASAGGSIVFGGSVNSTDTRANQLFGYVVGGRPAFLTLNNDAVIGGVPEPESWVMMLIGFGLVGAAMRRRRARSGYAKVMC